MITIDDFAKVELRVGTVVECEELEGSEKLLKLTVDLGEPDNRIILSGIKKWYSPQQLRGKQYIFIANLQPRQMMGIESEGMILAAEGEDHPILLTPSNIVQAGSLVR